jgi:probable HAF family extracellular repeat protein
MRFRRGQLIVALSLLVGSIPAAPAVAAGAQAATQPAKYRIIDLGTLPGGSNSRARAINNHGDIVGQSDTADGQDHLRAVRWRDGVITNLGTLPGGSETFPSYSFATDINDNGEIVGNSNRHAFLWKDGVMTDLGTLGSAFDFSAAYGINNLGQIVGASLTDSGETHLFLWEQGRMSDLGVRLDTSRDEARVDINDDGQIAGTTSDGKAFLWEGGAIRLLGTLGFELADISLANAINRFGHVTGDSPAPTLGSLHGFLWRDGSMTDLGTLTGAMFSESSATSLNDSDEVVGFSTGPSGGLHGFVWRHGHMTDLGAFPAGEFATSSEAEDINNDSRIVGVSDVTAFGQRHAVLWIRR